MIGSKVESDNSHHNFRFSNLINIQIMSRHDHISHVGLSINTDNLKPLFKTNYLRHTGDIVLNWIIITLIIVICISYFSLPLYLFGVIIIGARMHALAILMHDATHFRFLKNKYWNDLITNIVTMYPIFTSIAKYRQNHLNHHRHLNTDDDPDWAAKLGKRAFTFPKSKMEFILSLLSYFFLYQGVMDAIWLLKRLSQNDNAPGSDSREKFVKLGFYFSMAIVLTITNSWLLFLLYWIIPYMSTFFMFQYIRSVAEHFGELDYDHELSSTRTVKATLVEQFFIAPHNVGFHLEHHLFPGVPYYNLPKLHNTLWADRQFRNKAHITNGYVKGLLNELG